MRYIFLYLIGFILSLPLMAATSNPIFIGDFSPELKNSIISKFNSGNTRDSIIVIENPPPTHCDSLTDMYDTISGCIWSTITWNVFTAYVVLPDFPNCTFHVLYRVKECPNNPSVKQIDIISYAFESIGTGCDSLVNYLNSGNDYEKAVKSLEIENDIYLLLGKYEIGQSASFLPCDSLGNEIPQLIFYRNEACTSMLLVNVEYASYCHRIYRKITCNSGVGCCKTSISFCDSLGVIVPNVVNNEPIGTVCKGYPIETDYEHLMSFYLENFPNAVRITFDTFPCISSCN